MPMLIELSTTERTEGTENTEQRASVHSVVLAEMKKGTATVHPIANAYGMNSTCPL